jgi:hypothetical protein
MLRVHGYYGVIGGEAHDPLASGDEGLFVGEGEAVSGFERRNRRGEAGESDDTV